MEINRECPFCFKSDCVHSWSKVPIVYGKILTYLFHCCRCGYNFKKEITKGKLELKK